ncbi:hypothetical protein FIT77_02490 [Candidatus Methylopumilus universalis]|uniref:chitobiase/beta-hexosaminidase C-terminal domain-containing protein n=1 Tax=Candidatus Methylopumilus universalis TaxID=2588536 RepID=UPI00111E6E90|nr:chitobiase/beta-hexosaminidase C-terminal domain-containing protein [Candidatus Methylopumilus universalis]QDC96187.1 hypothetical protein FIT77_02490 [Candidatus Methylopumilus universalis]
MIKNITSFLFLLLSIIQSSKKTLSYILSVLLLWFVSAQAISFAQDPIVDPIEIEWRQLNPSKTELLNKGLSAINLGEYKDANSSIKPNISMDGGGFNYRSQSNGSLITLSPQYSKQTGFAIGGVFAKSITDNAALGVIFNAGPDRNEWLVNAGYDINQNQRVILSLGQLRQNLEFNFQSGLEKTQVTQNSGALSYQYLLGKSWLNAAEFNAYISDTPSINLSDRTWYTNTDSLYELWNDPRRIAGAKVEGVQSRLVFTPTTKTTLKLGLGAEHLSYDLSLGKDTYTRATGSAEFNQRLESGFNLNASANLASSQNRFGLALSRSFKDGQLLSVDALAIRGRDNTFDDNLITFNFSQTFGGVKSNVAAMNMQDVEIKSASSNASQKDLANNDANPKANWVSNLVNAVAKRPTFLPSQVNAKIDTTASSTRLIAIDKTGIPAGSTIENATGILTVPIQVGGIDVPVSAIAGITKNGSAFTNSGQFALSGSTYLMINPNLISQPATTDTYIVTMTNVSGGGTTLATITVSHGSTRIDSVVIVSGILTPTITFANISKTFGESAFALSPSSDSLGAFTFTSSDTSVATISGSTVTILKNGVSTITATQAANGNYSSGTATATLTVGAAGIVAAPTFSTAAGAIAFPTTITLSSTTAGATIYYTIDGSTPSTASTQGTSVVVNSAQTIKAFAIKTGYTDSSISSAAYTQAQATAPTSITLAKGSTAAVGGVTNVAIPSAGSTDSTGAVTGWVSSTASKIKFTVENGGSASSTITIAGGAYTSGADYTITAASTLTVVVTTTETGKTSATRTFSISVAAEPTYETTGLIINYDATSFSNNGIWTNSGAGGAAYNGVVTGSVPVVNSPSTTNNPTALSISNQTNTRTNYIDTRYSANDNEWTIEIIAKAPGGGSGNSIIRKEKQAGATTGEYWIGVQGAAYYFRNQASRGADGSFHVLTFTSDGKIFVDNIERQGITGSNVTPSGNIIIVTDLFSEGGHTWQLSRFKYYNKILNSTERTLNQNQKGELGF